MICDVCMLDITSTTMTTEESVTTKMGMRWEKGGYGSGAYGDDYYRNDESEVS